MRKGVTRNVVYLDIEKQILRNESLVKILAHTRISNFEETEYLYFAKKL